MSDELYLTELISADILQQIQDVFSDLTGIAALTADKDGIAVTKGSNFTEFCTKYTRSSPVGIKRCEECDKIGAQLSMQIGKSCSYVCHAGLMDFASPIVADGKMVGSFIGGQVLVKPPNLDKFAKIADEIGVDRGEYIEAVKKIKIVDPAFMNKAAQALSVLASVLSNMAYNGYKLYRNNIEIEKAAQAKSDFLANMSHEIRTPMNAVLGMAEMALREEMSPAARDYVHQIRSSGKNLLVIINDILDFSKIESGKMDIVIVTYEPYSIFNNLASIVNSRIGSKEIEFTMDIPPNMPSRLLGDNMRIQQILVNLLTNAVKYTKSGSIHLKVEFVPDENDNDTVIMKANITDTGCGIKKEDLGKLFKSFQQVDSKRNRNIEGTGLGLAITKRLLLLMNGNITVQSVYERGSTFSIELPQKIVSRAEPIAPPEKPLSVALFVGNKYVKSQIKTDLERIRIEYTDIGETGSPGSSYDFFIVERVLFKDKIKDYFLNNKNVRCIVIDDFGSAVGNSDPRVKIVRKPVYFANLYAALGIIHEYTREDALSAEDFSFTAPDAHILIVDDNSVNLIVAKGLIEPLKMQVDTAASAAETIEMIKESKYDLIFMDHMMPEVDGVETTHIIRRLIPSYADVPIIALTANAVDGTREMFIREGMNDFVAKPIDTNKMISALRKWLPQEKIIPIGKDKEAAPQESGTNIPKIKGLNIDGALKLLGSESLYMSVLKEYYSSIEKKSSAINEHFSQKDWKEYTVEVHALKSTSKQIGADELSALAAELEKAGNKGDTDTICEKHKDMMDKYLKYKEILKPYFPEIKSNSRKISVDLFETMQLLDDLQDALNNYDTLMIDEVIEKMSEYSFDIVSEEFFGILKAAADDSDIDVCLDVVRRWKTDIAHQYIERQ